MRQFPIACLLCVTVGWVSNAAGAETRMGVIASKAAKTQNLAALLEFRLGQRPSTALVERGEIDKVLGEQELQALLAADAPGKRAALGKMLKADLLVFLADSEQPKPHVMVVVCETARGLRLCAEPVFLTNQAETDVAALLEKVEAAAKKGQEKITDIVAVPPLVNNSLTQEADNLQGGFACFVEQTLLRRPGLLVVELAEAKALAQEMASAARRASSGDCRCICWASTASKERDGPRSPRPVRLAAAARPAGAWAAGGERPCVAQISRAAPPGRHGVDRQGRGKTGPAKRSPGGGQALGRPRARVRENRPVATGLGLGRGEPVAQSPSTGRARRRPARDLGNQRGRIRMRSDSQQAFPRLRAALPHLEAYFCGTKVPFADRRTWNHGKWGGSDWRQFVFRLKCAKGTMRCLTICAIRRTASWSAKAAAKVWDESFEFLCRWGQWDEKSRDWGIADQTDTLAARDAWLRKELPAICEHRLKLLRDFSWMGGQRDYEWSSFKLHGYYPPYYGLLMLPDAGGHDVSGLLTEMPNIRIDYLPDPELYPVYLDFFAKVKKMPDPHLQELATRAMERFGHLPELRKVAEKETREQNDRIAKDLRQLSFPAASATPRQEPGSRLSSAYAAADRSGGDDEVVERPEVGKWVPIYNGCDLVCSHYDQVALMKEKGRLRVLPVRIAQSDSAFKDGSHYGGHRCLFPTSVGMGSISGR